MNVAIYSREVDDIRNLKHNEWVYVLTFQLHFRIQWARYKPPHRDM